MLESQVRELYARVVWSHKTQEKCADILLARHRRLKFWQILLSAATTTGILVTIFGDMPLVSIASAILSSILFGLNAYSKDYDLGEIAEKHSNAANDMWDIREKYLSLLTDLKAETLSIQQVQTIRDSIQVSLAQIYKGAPRTISEAYKQATNGLKKLGEMTFNDDEIDSLLHPMVRKK
ncbi:MAG: hypothetical protein C0490_16940 [Marivirga sp.]|nr:hypothetical protein [Marivirga sp.]